MDVNCKCYELHVNGLEHLDIELGGVEKFFDLGYQFEKKEPDDYIEEILRDGNCMKTWLDPYLVLHISVRTIDNCNFNGSLQYNLRRDKWENESGYSINDKYQLLKLAKPKIEKALLAIRNGDKHETIEYV